jgi:hypothetical protein
MLRCKQGGLVVAMDVWSRLDDADVVNGRAARHLDGVSRPTGCL